MASESLRLVLADSTNTMLREIEQGATQRSVAMTYALALRQCREETDWPTVNRAIIKRWSKSGLNRIKQMAWSGRCFE